MKTRQVDAIVCSLLERGLGDTVSKEVLDAMFRNSGGMPNAIADVMELVRQDGGSIHLDEATKQWRWKPQSHNGETVLHAARAAFIARIDNLPLETKDILKIAACTCDAKQKFRLHDLVNVIEADLATKSRYVKASHAAGVRCVSPVARGSPRPRAPPRSRCPSPGWRTTCSPPCRWGSSSTRAGSCRAPRSGPLRRRPLPRPCWCVAAPWRAGRRDVGLPD
jgi:hypothetical protein